MKFLESVYITLVYLVMLFSPCAILVGTVATAIDYYAVSQSILAAVVGSFVGGSLTLCGVIIVGIILGGFGIWLENSKKKGNKQ